MRTINKQKQAAMLQALEKSLGVVTTAAREVGISRQTHSDWMNNDPEYAAKVREMKEVALDFSESALFQRIQNGSDTAIIFHLKTQGKHRGYIERTEVVQQDKLQEQFDQMPDEAVDELMLKRLEKLRSIGNEIQS